VKLVEVAVVGAGPAGLSAAAEAARAGCEGWNGLFGSELTFNVDTICLAVGLTPMAELAWIAGCTFLYVPELAGPYGEASARGKRIMAEQAAAAQGQVVTREGAI